MQRFWAVLGLSLALWGCGDEPQEEAPMAQPVKLFTVDSMTKGRLRHYPGKVVATEGSELAFRVSGQLEKFAVRAGEEVKKGQLLAALDPADFRNQLADRQAQYDLANSQYQRSISLHERGVISESQFDELKARRLQAQAALSLARDNVNYTRLKAPYAGTVARTYVENFQFVQAKEPILYLQGNKDIDIEFAVSERFFTNLREGGEDYQPDVRFEGAPDKVFKASYKEHEASADDRTQTYIITLTMANPEGIVVLPGMSVDVAIDLTQIMRKASAWPQVPVEAVFNKDGEDGAYVWRFDPQANVVNAVEVTLGQVVGDGVEITAGLDAGDRIVSAGVHHLKEGQAVRELVKERGL
ncbi:MAG: efflux RND transporter periplasmic adaptor subunit [Alcanivorax sediminis]|uniref:Efflux RND transporter periplasmic adaptor subunit n=1 Tax=Alcanivorax sediminis TaxID=2663008 RepID=A0A6N7LV03_9GAMM|nr:efflux RND transporter periplasmic adaptor subunit [Alcanivorax sediminis]MQX51950.1 efflux RND transporter periplasmic adaptor subunit [Alcanivorax sediminis]